MFYSEKISNLVKLHVTGKAINKKLSNTILNMEPEKQLALIGSYIDGDGCLASNKSTKNSAISIATSSATLTQQIPMMLERSGILASTHTMRRKPGKNSVATKSFTQHTMFIGGSFISPLRKHSKKASSVALPKQNSSRCFVYENYIAVPVMSVVKKSYTGWAYNISVGSDENSNYGVNHSYHLNGIASHNCYVAFSQCSICAHVAKTTKDYCFHVKAHKGGAYNGQPVYEINRNIEFIELSWVSVGADSQAKLLEVYARQKGGDFHGLLQEAAKGVMLAPLQSIGVEYAVMQGIRRANDKRSK